MASSLLEIYNVFQSPLISSHYQTELTLINFQLIIPGGVFYAKLIRIFISRHIVSNTIECKVKTLRKKYPAPNQLPVVSNIMVFIM